MFNAIAVCVKLSDLFVVWSNRFLNEFDNRTFQFSFSIFMKVKIKRTSYLVLFIILLQI